jgi:hypothetical protein
MDELLVHKDADGPVGDLARELISITENYRAGELSLAEKNELVEEVIKIYAAHDSADKEIIARWSVTVAQNLISIV